MSPNRDKEYIPASIRISLEESPFWGRLLSVSPEKLELLSQFEFKKGKMLALTFDLGPDRFEDLRGRITETARDACGYFHYTLSLPDQTQRKAIFANLHRAAADQ